MKPVYFVLLILLIANPLQARQTLSPEVEEGNLIFVKAPSNRSDPFVNAILETGKATIDWLRKNGISVPKSQENDIADHVGMVVKEKNSLCIIEALPQAGVILTPIDQFWERNSGATVFVGKLSKDWAPLIPDAIITAKAVLGRPYANGFQRPEDGLEFYCSSLIQFAFRNANRANPVFINPKFYLIFDPEKFWMHYFQVLRLTFPYHLQGSNPTELLHSPILSYTSFHLPQLMSQHLVLRLRAGRSSLLSK